jgi:2-polyprenyl-3-methyl-5-hydroxy-6-metoxy-1,4-benzoquinol methylase
MSDGKDDYRQRMYGQYVGAHLASIYNISVEAFEKQRSTFKSYFGKYLPLDKKAMILDAGCGFGSFLYHLHKEGYENVVGVDVSPDQVMQARKLGLKNVECADLVGYLEKHPQEFDCITALDVVEHFKKEELVHLLDAVYSSLKHDGVFIMQSPNADGPFGSRYRYWDFTHEVAFTKTSISQVLSVIGFKNIEVHPTGPVVHGILSGIRWLIWNALRLVMKIYLLIETGVFNGHILSQNLIAVARK